MTKLDHALALAAAGFWVFPIKADEKTPAHKGWQDHATRDASEFPSWFAENDFNIGIYTGKFQDDEALLVLDIDTKNGKDGNTTLLGLELAGFELPDTRGTATPTGGNHLFFRVPVAVRQSVGRLGPGLDVRSRGGFVLGPGSTIDGRAYGVSQDVPVQPAPAWLVDRCGVRDAPRAERGAAIAVSVDQSRAVERGVRYLTDDAPLAVEGAGGDETTYKVAARLKDFGVEEDQAFNLMADHWNPRCSPPWSSDELGAKVYNAYRYGQEPVGAASPEADFAPTIASDRTPVAGDESLHPVERLNKDHIYVVASDCIIWETTDLDGQPKRVHSSVQAFNRKLAPYKLEVGNKKLPTAEVWMEDPRRRTADWVVFMPGQAAPARVYNLWRGFAYEPETGTPTAEAQSSVDAWRAHALENVCNGNAELCRWLIGFFAHLVQRPWEKPLVAVVFKGGKGVGKNALVERVGCLLGNHFLVADDGRYLVGNFNSHMENSLLFALDEAFWSGNKQAEGRLKGIITGKSHVIERKGQESYTVDNRTRVCIIGNEDWLVPATHDERRFAVFEVGDGRKQDNSYFEAMRVGMERGGYRLLLSYLQGYDLSDLNFSAAPSTAALLDQKHATLGPFASWWLACLTEGRLAGGDFEGWQTEAECERFRGAWRRYAKEHGTRFHHKSDNPDDRTIGRELKPWGVTHAKKRGAGYVYRIPALDAARAAWSSWIGHEVEWTE